MVLLAGLALTVHGAPTESFRAGFAEKDITPAIGMEMPGNYMKVFHKALHDPCKVRAVVFDDGKSVVALVGVDALMVPRPLVATVRKEIQERFGLAPSAVLVGASHSHSSGPTGMVQPGEFDGASPLVQKLAYEQSSCADAKYLEQVRRAMVEAVGAAMSNRVAVLAGVGTGQEERASFNRRFFMQNGLTYTHPGKGNPEIDRPAGPIDPQVGVIGVWDQQKKFLGCVVNYACHATTSPPGISANWIYYLEKTIRGALAPDAVVVFLQGFCGDVTQVDNLSKFAERPGEEGAQYVGGRVGAEAVKVLVGMAKGGLLPVASRSEVLLLPRRVPDAERVKQSLELVQKEPSPAGRTDWIFAKETVLLNAMMSHMPKVETEVQAIQVGPVIFLANPGEVFCQFGLDLRSKSHFPFTFPVELANGCVGYIPTEAALGEHGGGYETRLTSYSNLESNAGRLMNEALLKLEAGLQPGSIPLPPPAPAFKEAWTYGRVPSELR